MLTYSEIMIAVSDIWLEGYYETQDDAWYHDFDDDGRLIKDAYSIDGLQEFLREYDKSSITKNKTIEIGKNMFKRVFTHTNIQVTLRTLKLIGHVLLLMLALVGLYIFTIFMSVM